MAKEENARVSGILGAAVANNLINDDTPSIDAFDLVQNHLFHSWRALNHTLFCFRLRFH